MTAKQKQTIKNDNKGIVYCTPEDDIVQLPKIHLSDQFRKYKEAILDTRISISDIAAIIGLWLPILTISDFKNILGISPDTIKGFYICFAIIVTSIILKPLYHLISREFSDENKTKYEIDPEKRVRNIIAGQSTNDGISKNEYFIELGNEFKSDRYLKLISNLKNIN